MAKISAIKLGKVKIAGKMWTVYEGGVPSRWYSYMEPDNRRIFMPKLSNVTPNRYLELAIHEAIHATMPFMDEDAVDKRSLQIKRLLWVMGIRPTANPESD